MCTVVGAGDEPVVLVVEGDGADGAVVAFLVLDGSLLRPLRVVHADRLVVSARKNPETGTAVNNHSFDFIKHR